MTPRRLAVQEYGPPLVVALLLLPWIISHGRAWPWHPSMIDLDVYRLAAQDMLEGRNIYRTATPGWDLHFIYPPIAALLAAPLALGPATWWRLVWAAATVWAQQAVLRRCGVGRGMVLGLLGALVVLAVEPVRTTLGYGQVNTLLMAMVVLDVLDAPGRRRVLPRGVLLGLAAAIKLTPLLFVVFLLLRGRRRSAAVAAGTFGLATAVGWLVMRDETVSYFRGLAQGSTGTAGPLYVGNQSLLGLATRAAHSEAPTVVRPTLAVAALIALLAVWAAVRWWASAPVMATALAGLATCLASPLSWTHHHVWVLPLLACLLVGERTPWWWQVLAATWVAWVSGGFVLWLLPRTGLELFYTPLQVWLSGLTPILTGVLVLGALLARPPVATPGPRVLGWRP